MVFYFSKVSFHGALCVPSSLLVLLFIVFAGLHYAPPGPIFRDICDYHYGFLGIVFYGLQILFPK
jgi:ABC-type polysaccharide/polyol phosphate export permease